MAEDHRSRRQFLTLGGAALGAALAGCSAPTELGDDTEDTPQQRDEMTPLSAQPEETPTQVADSPYEAVYRETIDSVVLVRTGQGQGTGFVFDDSHVVTNAHVVGRASSVDVRFSDGTWSSGDVIGTDRHTDLAAVEVAELSSSATPLPFVENQVDPGEEVVAIGNPFNLDGSVTTGVVSGTDRSIPAPTGYRIPDAIQTDAAVNPGNSGGPLVSLDGRVVAVINSGGGDNIAFGISAALTQRVVPELIETGSYEHAYLGVSFRDVTPAIADAMGMDDPRGLLVVQVRGGGPAAGVLEPSRETTVVDRQRVRVGGDVILAIDGTAVMTAEDVGSYLALNTRPGDTVTLTIYRDGSRQQVDLELGTRPS